MKKFLFGIHCHQPIGNFENIVVDAVNDCYRPFLQSLGRHPAVKAVVHFSGCLFDFIEQHSPDLSDLLNELGERGQIELLGGGYYEPILPIWPVRDQKAQLQKMRAFIKEKFRKEVEGIWLSERVWEPQLPSVIHEAGYRATFLDDAHFLAAGLVQNQIHGYFRTEDHGKMIAVFPINKALRYMIPFQPVSSLGEFFRSQRAELLTMVDDGEKFGVWPGTAKWVYRDGWLESFLSFLEKGKEVETISLKEALALKDEGIVYLPTASYEEMEEWTLPASRQLHFRKIKATIKDEYSHGLIRGGFFRNFFAKYAESRWLYYRLLALGERMAVSHPAYNEYLKVQCNCAYWHGIFGGLYLPHLRHALWKQMIKVDRELGDGGLKEKNPASGDLNRNLRNDDLQIFLSEDGTVREIDHFRSCSNIVNTLGRRIEGYHLLAEEKKDASGLALSIHEEIRQIPENLAGFVVADAHPRDVFRDYLLSSFDEVQTMGSAVPTGTEKNFQTEILRTGKSFIATLTGDGFRLEKRITLDGKSLVAAYHWPEDQPKLTHLICSDFFILDGFYRMGSEDRRSLEEPAKGLCSSLWIMDTIEKVDISIYFQEPLFTYIIPVKTVSLSESGYNFIRQSLAVIVRAPDRRRFEIHLIIGG